MLRRVLLPVLCLAGLAVSALTFGPSLRLTLQGVTDFMPLYAGGKLAFTNALYDGAQVRRVEEQSAGWSSPTRLYIRLPFEALFLWPLAQLRYQQASAIWEISCIAAIVAFAVLWPHKPRWAVALACCWSLPAFMTVAEGQDTAFLLLWIALAVILLRKNQPRAAGLVASLCAAKFHLFLMFPLWILRKRQWHFVSGMAAGGAVLLALSFVSGGLDWPVRYYRFVKDPANNPYTNVMPNLHGLVAKWGHHNLLEMIGVIAIAAAVWIAVRNANPEFGIAAALVGGILSAPHDYMADCVVLIPAILIVLSNPASLWTRVCGMLLLLPFPYLLLLLGIALPAQMVLALFLFLMAWETAVGQLNAVRSQAGERELAQ